MTADRGHPVWWVLFGLATAAVIVVSLAPVETVEPAASVVPDYVGHAAGYSVLGVLAMLAARWPVRWIIALTILGAMLEVLQPILANRFASISDVVANTVGVLIGVALGLFFTRYRRPRQ